MASPVNRQRLIQYFFFAVFLFLLWQVLRILSPFYTALLGSAILSVLIYPAHAWLLKRVENHPSFASALTTTGVVLIIVLPILLIGWTLIREAAKVYPVVQQWIESTQSLRERSLSAELPPALQPLWRTASEFADTLNIDPKEILLKNVDELSTTMTGIATSVIKNTVFVVFNLLILVFTLFFFLRDGPQIIGHLVELIPMAPEHKEAILERLQTTLYAVIRGAFTVALVQGALAGLGFALFGVPFPVLLGAATALLAPVPLVGTAAIWVPVAVGLALNGSVNQALYVTLWSVLVVGLIDNLLRPILISAGAKIPMLLLFFGMLGGLRVYGFTGLLVGPIVLALLLAFINIYRREYRWLLTSNPKEG